MCEVLFDPAILLKIYLKAAMAKIWTDFCIRFVIKALFEMVKYWKYPNVQEHVTYWICKNISA